MSYGSRTQPRRSRPSSVEPRQSCESHWEALLYGKPASKLVAFPRSSTNPRVARRRSGAPRASVSGWKFRGKIDHVEHHLAHLSSAFLVSPFHEAAVASVDGFGDFSSAAWGSGQGGTINIQGRALFPDSLGIFYQAVTQYLGFPNYGDEYKVMGRFWTVADCKKINQPSLSRADFCILEPNRRAYDVKYVFQRKRTGGL